MSLGNLLRPRAVDSAPAPDVPGPHVDIVTVTATDPVEVVETRSPVERGTCWHHGHLDHGGCRYGYMVRDDRASASLLPCSYSNRDGR